MKSPIIVQVSERDIRLGHPGWADRCPIGHALRHMGEPHPDVGNRTCRFKGKRYRLPMKTRDFVRHFDAGMGPFHPFKFRLDRVSPEYFGQKEA